MNPHNLAICFAPVLMLDTSDYLDLQVVNIMFYHCDDSDDDQNYDQFYEDDCNNDNPDPDHDYDQNRDIDQIKLTS